MVPNACRYLEISGLISIFGVKYMQISMVANACRYLQIFGLISIYGVKHMQIS